MVNQIFSLSPLIVIFLCFPTGFAQSPAQAPVAQSPVAQPPPKAPVAPGPVPSGPPNITAILEKQGHFSTLIRLLKTTNMDSVITSQLNDSSQGLTVFAPSDKAFSKLSAGSLNSFNNEQKARLIKLHLISSFLSQPEFQTVSNPLNTEAGSNGQYPLNVTVSGTEVKLTTGMVNTTISSTIYADGQLAVYQVDKVLLPLHFSGTPSPEPAPAPATATASTSSSSSASASASAPSKPDKADQPPSVSTADSSVQASGAITMIHHAMSFAYLVVVGIVFIHWT
ncbi:fasciclin-like arabinogalactan protein 11 [Diospyros lotus]|uniref:fasciclin-like arabinogalactan protein 11 n=1 Tax=Diospyros lotus TaxID=55363 RepID=UPI00225AB3BF|nr:fasciclin-like arabinogalactan protein 11 [Diospyros lotus]